MLEDNVLPVDIQPWEYFLLIPYVILFVLVLGRRVRLRKTLHPEYKYYLPGLFARLFGAICLVWVYVYYYSNGDTISFFNSATPISKLFFHDTGKFLQVFVLPNTWDNYWYLFSPETGYPWGYIYADSRTYFLVKIIAVLCLFSFNSIIITSALVCLITYGGIWNLYGMLVRYYPRLKGELALAVIFFPSCVFWGSGILKDTFAFSAACWFIYALERIFFQKKRSLLNWSYVLIASWLMIAMKPYVFMTIFPAALMWIMYQRVQRIRNAVVRVLLLPSLMVLLGVGTLTVMDSMEGRLGKFSLDSALQTIVVNQADLKRQEQYGHNYFDIGDVEATWSSILSKFPQATFAGLFRPQLVESSNIVMVLAGLENTFLILISAYILFRSRLVFFISLLMRNPLLQMCFVFSVGYAFMVGVTTPNFGALVRFKIPMLPFMVSGLFITNHILNRRIQARALGRRFHFDDFAEGDPERSQGDDRPKKVTRRV